MNAARVKARTTPRAKARTTPRRGRLLLSLLVATALALALVPAPSPAGAQLPTPDDPRVGLGAGLHDAATATRGMEHLASRLKPDGVNGTNSDIAFKDDIAIAGNYSGFHVWNIANPANPTLTAAVFCPGSQNDVSIYGNLLFLSVEATSARIDCASSPAANAATRFRGVRIFDISNPASPTHVGGVQTCRGSHTHTVVPDPDDAGVVYIYNSGTASVRSSTEPPGGCGSPGPTNPADSRWSIDVIRVPLANPAAATLVGSPRLFADPETGAINGLQNAPPTGQHPSGTSWSPNPVTDACHDITAYPEIGLAAGACEGNGLLIDISDPANPVRVAAVADPNFAYWHSATFNNDGTKVVFTDEWGGGAGARCRATDQLDWGANGIYDIVRAEGQPPALVHRSYYKLPVVQTNQENCVAHNGSLVPVPGRDVMVQGWYQGGISVFDFTDSAAPVEIAYFDRGPINATTLNTGGFWSAYWYDGHVYGNEISRGFDTFRFTPTDALSARELAAAEAVSFGGQLNAQSQLSFLPPPAILTDPTDATVDALETATFTASAGGGELARWEQQAPGSSDWETVVGATAVPLTVVAHGDMDGTQYRAVFANTEDVEATTEAATLTVDRLYTSVLVDVDPLAPAFGQGVVLTATVAPATAGGMVQFSVDGTDVGDPVAVVGGVATSAPVTGLAVGSYVAGAAYPGDVDHEPSNGATSFTVGQASSSVSVLSAGGTPEWGSPVYVDALVTPTGATGMVQFAADGVDVGAPVPVVDGVANGALLLAVGEWSVTATYSGDTGHLGAVSEPLTVSVDRASSNVDVWASPTAPVWGQDVIFTASVWSGAPELPSGGTVQFAVDGVDVGAPVPVVDGVADTAPVSGLAAGDRSVTATFSGDAGHLGSTSGPVIVTVGQAPSSVEVSASPVAPVRGQDVTLTATVAPAGATGAVQFAVDGTDVGDPVDVVDGEAVSAPISDLAHGDRSVTATYSGDTNLLGSVSEPLVLTVARNGSTTTIVEVAPEPVGLGDDVTVTVTVVPAPLDGEVEILVGDDVVGTVELDEDGQGRLAVPGLGLGDHVVTARFAGDDDLDPSEDTAEVTVLSADEAFVRRLYQVVLARAADEAGVAHWVGRLEGGTSHLAVAQALGATAEARSRIVRQVYVRALFRSPDASGLEYWSERLRTGMTAEALLASLLASPEVRDRMASPADLAQRYYMTYLGRPGDEAGLAYWAGRLSSPDTSANRQAVATAFGRTAEVTVLASRGSAQRVCGTTAGATVLEPSFVADRHHLVRLDGVALVLVCRPGTLTG